MKTLVIDARMVGPVGHGIAKYLEEAVLHFNEADPLCEHFKRLLKVGSLDQIDMVFLIRPDCPIESPVRRYKTHVVDLSCYDPRSWVVLPLVLLKLGADLFFNPTFASYPGLPCPFIQTIHDLNHLFFGTVLQKLYYKVLLKRSARNSACLLTVSNTMKRQIADWLRANDKPAEVIYNRVEPPRLVNGSELNEVLCQMGLKSGEYFLCVTNSKPHKNLEMLIAAYHAYRMNQNANSLTQEKWKIEFKEAESEKKLPLVVTAPIHGIPDRLSEGLISKFNLSQNELSALYLGCRGFFFPSLYEGFGRPPLEAALAGVQRVVVSDIPVHHEVETFSPIHFRFVEV